MVETRPELYLELGAPLVARRPVRELYFHIIGKLNIVAILTKQASVRSTLADMLHAVKLQVTFFVYRRFGRRAKKCRGCQIIKLCGAALRAN